MSGAPDSRSPALFFGLVFLLSLPLWIAGAWSGAMLLPGLPLAALMAVCPGFAALFLVAREDGRQGVAALLRRSIDPRGAGLWLAAAVLLPLAAAAATFLVLHVARGTTFGIAPPLTLMAMSLSFLVAAWAEELGWSGYAIDPLQTRWSALPAALVIGVVWAVWHFVPLLQAGRGVAWIGWWTLATLSTRVVIVGLYNRAGRSIPAAVLFHAAGNLAVFGLSGTYDPQVTGLVLAGMAILFTAFGLKAPDDKPAPPCR